MFGFTMIFAALICLLPAYSLAHGLYNIFLHPLRRTPGPTLWRVSRLPFLISMLSGNLPKQIKHFHDQYGPVIRVAPDELSILNGWKDIYSSRYLDRPPQWRILPPGVKADDLISSTRADHSRFRRAILPGFSFKALDEQEEMIIHYINLLIEKLHKIVDESPNHGPTSINLVEWISYAAFDLTSDLGWGRPLECLETGKYQPWMTMLTQYQAALFAVSFKYFPPLDRLVTFLTPSFALEALNLVMSIAKENVNYRLNLTHDRPDFISPIIFHNKTMPERKLSVEEIETNSTLFILGGTEPVTVALTGTLQHLLTNKHGAMEKLAKEIRDAFMSDEDITGATSEQLPYLNAVLKEGLRMCPPFPDGLRRIIPHGGAVIQGTAIPGGTTVSSACWSTFQSPDMFHDPSSFLPERWIDTGKGPFASDRREFFHPFSLGPRNCPGQRLAWLEMRVLLAKLLWNFEVAVPEGKTLPPWTDQKIFWHWMQDRMDLELRDRVRVGMKG